MIDFYELLGVSRDASKQEIKNAYHAMVKKYHPDVNKSEEANEIIVSLNEAKEVLLNDEKRKEYDLLLDEIDHSKQFSKDESETYSAKTHVYRETYSEGYVTKWGFFVNYLKNGIDSFLIKFIKSLLVIINSLLFFFIKIIVIVTMIFISFLGVFVDYFAGLIMILGFIALFVLSGEAKPDYIPFIPANVEMFFMLGIVAVLIELAKECIINGTVNLFVLFQNIEDKIFIKILMK